MLNGFHFREALRYFTRSKRLNLTALATISLALMGLGLVAALQAGILQATDFLEAKVEVVAFLNEQLPSQDVAAFLARVKQVPQVAAVEYRSQEEALKEFSADPALKRFVDALGSNPLPASVRVRLTQKTPETVRAFVAWLNELPGVEESTYGGGEADRLLNGLRLTRIAALILTLCLTFAAVIIIGNIINLMVYARREEIAIMRLIGATTWFIRGPFLIWGSALGMLGGLVAAGLLYGIGWALAYYARNEIGLDLAALLPPQALRWALFGGAGLAVAGALLGFAGSLLAVGRQLRE
jgi:cell division transport system permease protein